MSSKDTPRHQPSQAAPSENTLPMPFGIVPATVPPHLGHPPSESTFPQLVDNTLDVDLYLGRSVFLASLYTEAGEFLQDLHRKVYPRYQVALLATGNSIRSDFSDLDAFCDRIVHRPITFQDLERPSFEPLVAGLLDWLAGKDLWKDWFIDYALAKLDAYQLNVLVNPPTIDSILTNLANIENGVMIFESKNVAVSANYHDWIEFSVSQEFFSASRVEFPNLEAQIYASFREEISLFKAKHAHMRDAWLKKQQSRRKQLNYYRWLATRLINRYSIKYIADTEPTVDGAERPSEDTISHGILEAAAHLDIQVPRFRGRYPKHTPIK